MTEHTPLQRGWHNRSSVSQGLVGAAAGREEPTGNMARALPARQGMDVSTCKASLRCTKQPLPLCCQYWVVGCKAEAQRTQGGPQARPACPSRQADGPPTSSSTYRWVAAPYKSPQRAGQQVLLVQGHTPCTNGSGTSLCVAVTPVPSEAAACGSQRSETAWGWSGGGCDSRHSAAATPCLTHDTAAVPDSRMHTSSLAVGAGKPLPKVVTGHDRKSTT